jgi:hypothetical protein
MTELHNLTVAQLQNVIKIKAKIETLVARLGAISGEAFSPLERPGRRKMSRAARAAIAAAQRARWAKIKGAKAAGTPKKRRRMSAAAKAKMAAAARKRWAKAKAKGKNRL